MNYFVISYNVFPSQAQPSWSKKGAYDSDALFRCSTLGLAPGYLISNIRLGWKCLPGTNTLANYNHL